MKYTLIWRPGLLAKLASIWLDAPNRDAVERAANEIERRLRVHPQTQGESRDGGTRILSIPPLAVLFEVVEDDRQVVILALRFRAGAAS